jgi:hypothetical protein
MTHLNLILLYFLFFLIKKETKKSIRQPADNFKSGQAQPAQQAVQLAVRTVRARQPHYYQHMHYAIYSQ